MIKVVSCRFQKSLGGLDMFTVEECSEVGLRKHFAKTCLWQSVISEIHRPWESSFFLKVLKFDVHIEDGEKIPQKVFTFFR